MGPPGIQHFANHSFCTHRSHSLGAPHCNQDMQVVCSRETESTHGVAKGPWRTCAAYASRMEAIERPPLPKGPEPISKKASSKGAYNQNRKQKTNELNQQHRSVSSEWTFQFTPCDTGTVTSRAGSARRCHTKKGTSKNDHLPVRSPKPGHSGGHYESHLPFRLFGVVHQVIMWGGGHRFHRPPGS